MAAVIVDLDANVRRRGQPFERSDGDERVVARGDDQRRRLNLWDIRQRRRLAVVIERICEAAARGGEEIVEVPDAQPRWKLRQRWVGVVCLPDAGEPHE